MKFLVMIKIFNNMVKIIKIIPDFVFGPHGIHCRGVGTCVVIILATPLCVRKNYTFMY